MVVPLLSALALSAFSAEGTSTCPTPEEVSRKLAALADLPAAGVLRVDRAERTEDGVRIRLLTGPGETIGEQTLPGGETCDALASAAAAIAATWLGNPQAEVPGVRLPAPVAAPVEAAHWRLLLGGQVAGEGSQNGVAPFLALWSGIGRRDSRFSARLALFFDGPLSAKLPPGSVSWQRAGVAIEPELRLATVGPIVLSLEASALLSVLWASGSGFTSSQTSATASPGLGAGLEGTWQLGSTAVGLELGPLVWLGQEQIQVTGAGSTPDLAQIELVLGLCVSWASG